MENLNEIAKEFVSMHENCREKAYGNSVISNNILIYYLGETKEKNEFKLSHIKSNKEELLWDF